MTDNFSWSDKDPGEAINYGVDFSSILKTTDTISSATVAATLKNGVGAVGDLVLVGSASIAGQTVAQRLAAGTAAAEYIVKFTIVTAGGETYIEPKCLTVAARSC